MITVFFGNDTTTVRMKAFAHVAALEEKGVEVVHIEAESYEAGACASTVGSVSLFGGKKLYILDTPSDNSLFLEEFLALLPDLGEGEYVVIEGALLAAEKKKYEKYGAKLLEFTKTTAARFNVFALADALSRKDKKMLWVGVVEARTHGLSSEEVIGTLWWQLKTLRLAKQTVSATEAGMKDFPYNKAKRAVSIFKESELERLSEDLLSVYNDGHSGVRDIDTALEAWALSL